MSVCADCGNKYGKYRVATSTWCEEFCMICGDEKPTTAAGDYGLKETRKEKTH